MNIFQRWKQTTIANKSLVISSFLMAFGTLFYAGAASLQVWIMKRSAHDASMQTDKIIKATQDQAGAAANMVLAADKQVAYAKSIADQTLAQAEATNKLARTSEEALIRTEKSLRPWVNAQRVFSTVKVAEGYVPIQVEVDNAGSSSALHAITYQESATICSNGPEHERFPSDPPYADFRSWPSTAMLTPGTGDLTDPYIINITHDRMIDLNMGRCTLYAYGIITYCDIFGRLHWQNYCGRWIPGTNTRFNTCYNYSDGDQDYPNETLSEISCPKSPTNIPPELLHPKHQPRRPITAPR